MKYELDRDEFFKTFQEFLKRLKELVKESENESVKNFTYKHCVEIQYLLIMTDDPRRFLAEITKLRQGWTEVSTGVFEHEEAESVNISLSKLERIVH